MTLHFADRLDALGAWRQELIQRVDTLGRYLGERDLLDTPSYDLIQNLRARLAGEKLVLAFVAEFSRGKSELINAIFFSDAGRRVLPAAPGRTTMCPVELGYEAGEPASLALLPIDTRLEGLSLAELRARPEAWRTVPLQVGSPDQLAEALSAVMRTRQVTVEEARALGFWSDESPQDNPPVENGRVEVPHWRHAVINYPHPLLQRGLVVLDTPGLNAIGAEPELTLGLLPSAHATVFILAADTGVTKSDLTIWRDHLESQSQARFVVLNKIDALVDPLTPPEVVRAQITEQCRLTGQLLGVVPERVFPISARQALAARVNGDGAGLASSRLPELEQALGAELLPQRRDVLAASVESAVRQLEQRVLRQFADQRRQLAEQLLELRGLRGKSGAKVRTMLARVDGETAEFEQCNARLQAMRVVQARLVKEALADISADRVRDLVAEAQPGLSASLLGFGARRAFARLCASLRAQLRSAEHRASELHDMLGASYNALNADFGFSLSLSQRPEFSTQIRDLDLLERNYAKYLGLTQALRLSQPKFMEQFRRMLLSRLRVVFEHASQELDMWSRSAATQVDAQLRERRRGFRRRREALERIQGAATELEQRIAEVEAQEGRAQQLQAGIGAQLARLLDQARQPAEPAAAAETLPMRLRAAGR